MAFTVTTPSSDAAWRPDHFSFAPTDVIPDSLQLQTSTAAGNIEGDEPSVRVAFITDDTAKFVAEADPIDEAQPSLSEALIHTSKVSMLVRVSREQYLQPQTPLQLSTSVSRAVTRRADIAYVDEQAPIGPDVAPVPGLLNWPQIIDGGAVADDLDGLIDIIVELQENLATPTHLVLSPSAWGSFRKLKSAETFNSSLLGAGTTDAREMLLSLPVLVNVAMPQGTGLVIDQSAVISATGQVNVATSQDLYFDSDSIALRCTWRIGHTVPRPERIAKFTIGETGS